MKVTFLVLLMFSSFAHAKYVCFGKNEQCSAKRNIFCGDVEKIDAQTFRISRMQHITGCLAWGVSRIKSKNKLCKNFVSASGEKQKVRYLHGSDVRGEFDTAFDQESIGQIDCEILR